MFHSSLSSPHPTPSNFYIIEYEFLITLTFVSLGGLFDWKGTNFEVWSKDKQSAVKGFTVGGLDEPQLNSYKAKFNKLFYKVDKW